MTGFIEHLLSIQPDIALLFLIIGVMFLLFIYEPVRLDVTALAVLVTLVVLEPWTGVTTEDAVAGFASEATLAVLGFFIISEGVKRTGIVHYLGRVIRDRTGDNQGMQLLSLTGVSGLLSGAVNNTPIVGIMIPMASEIAELLYDMAHGNDHDLDVKDDFQVGARMVLPPYPYDDDAAFAEVSEGMAIRFDLDDPLDQGIHIEDVKQEDGTWRVAGATGEILVVAASGETIDEAQDELYSRASDVRLPCKYYRTDIGERWENDRKLIDWGYLEPGPEASGASSSN